MIIGEQDFFGGRIIGIIIRIFSFFGFLGPPLCGAVKNFSVLFF